MATCSQGWSDKAQLAKAFAVKADILSSIPGTNTMKEGKERKDSLKLFSDYHSYLGLPQ